MPAIHRVLILTLAVCPHLGAAAADENAIRQMYQNFQDAFAQKNVEAMYNHCDPSYYFVGTNGAKSTLEENRQAMAESLTKLRSIRVSIQPEASEMMGNTYLVRYRQVHEIQFPLKPKPSTNWFVAEDTWQLKNGHWRLMSTKVVSDSIADWRQRLEAQKKQMQAEDDQRASRRCLNGLGYGCGMPR